eukprot:303374-Chlamydomonas_euryale.AAC.1
MPPHAPAPGHALRTMSKRSASWIRPAEKAPARRRRSGQVGRREAQRGGGRGTHGCEARPSRTPTTCRIHDKVHDCIQTEVQPECAWKEMDYSLWNEEDVDWDKSGKDVAGHMHGPRPHLVVGNPADVLAEVKVWMCDMKSGCRPGVTAASALGTEGPDCLGAL